MGNLKLSRVEELTETETKVLAYIEGLPVGQAATAWGCSRVGLNCPPLGRLARDRRVDNALRRLKRLGKIRLTEHGWLPMYDRAPGPIDAEIVDQSQAKEQAKEEVK